MLELLLLSLAIRFQNTDHLDCTNLFYEMADTTLEDVQRAAAA
jgi:hypothetical protein